MLQAFISHRVYFLHSKACCKILLAFFVEESRATQKGKKSSLSQPSTSELPPPNEIMVLLVRSLDRNVLVFSKIVLAKNCQNRQDYITLQTKSLQLYCVDSLHHEMTFMTLDLYTTLKSTKVHRSERWTSFVLAKVPASQIKHIYLLKSMLLHK